MEEKKKHYPFFEYVKMVMSVAFVFTIGVLWSDYLTLIGQRIIANFSDPIMREIIALLLVVIMTIVVICLIVYAFGYKGEAAIQIFQSGI